MIPEINFDGEIPLLPNVRPVIILSGSNYEIGMQYSQQLVNIFGSWILKLLVKNKYSEKELLVIKQFETIIKEHAPEMVDIFKGIADGAKTFNIPLSYYIVLAKFSGADDFLSKSLHEAYLGEDCTGFAAWSSATKDNKLICSGSKDHKPRPEVTVVVFPSEGGNSFIWTPSTIMGGNSIGGHPGMNSKGLAYVHHGGSCWINRKPREKWTHGMSMAIAVIHTLRYAKGADQAKQMQLDYPDGCNHLGGFWVDTKGKGWIIESGNNPKAIRKPGDYGEIDYLYATNNGLCREVEGCQCLSPSKRNVYIRHGGWLGTGATISSVARNLQLWNMLHNYHGNIDLDFVKMMWRFSTKAPEYNSLEEAEKAYYISQGKGWEQTIGNLCNTTVGILQPDNGNHGLYHASWGCLHRKLFPFAPGKHYYTENQTFSLYEIKLHKSPENVIIEARDRAQYDLYFANQELSKLTYYDIAYASLENIFNKAAREWYKGDYYQEISSCGKEDNMINELNKSLRCFTRSQVFARQIINAFKLPPCCPEDLGLQPYKRLVK